MGTNYYQILDGKKYHIGKMSAAGYYCFDCKITLCKDGPYKVHKDESKWFDRCPKCGNNVKEETLDNSSVGKMLGFNDKTEEKQGVRSCCSFTWATNPSNIRIGIKDVFDEYGKVYKIEEFREMLRKECPIEILDMMGQGFS